MADRAYEGPPYMDTENAQWIKIGLVQNPVLINHAAGYDGMWFQLKLGKLEREAKN